MSELARKADACARLMAQTLKVGDTFLRSTIAYTVTAVQEHNGERVVTLQWRPDEDGLLKTTQEFRTARLERLLRGR